MYFPWTVATSLKLSVVLPSSTLACRWKFKMRHGIFTLANTCCSYTVANETYFGWKEKKGIIGLPSTGPDGFWICLLQLGSIICVCGFRLVTRADSSVGFGNCVAHHRMTHAVLSGKCCCTSTGVTDDPKLTSQSSDPGSTTNYYPTFASLILSSKSV